MCVERGFTLVELVVTMIVIGILAVFAIGRLDFSTTFDQRAVRDKVVAGLQFARKAAVAQRRYVCVCVGTKSGSNCTAGNQIQFFRDSRTPEESNAFCNGTSEAALALPVPDRDCGSNNVICSRTQALITAKAGGPGTCFDPQGRGLDATCSAAAQLIVAVPGQPDVTVEAETGHVH